MIQLKVTIQDSITPHLKSIEQKLINLPKEAEKEFIKNTPIRSGNARRSTKLQGKTIKANYAYAQRLEEGYSQQAPNGMIAPTEEFILKRFQEIMSGK
jgi:hypothetical protein